MSKFKDLTGKTFYYLEVLCRGPNKSKKDFRAQWLCRCSCGKELIVPSTRLLANRTKSCGCMKNKLIKRAKTTHGLTGHPLFKTFLGFKNRCYNPNEPAYPKYGGRGIIVEEPWYSNFMSFYDWAMESGWQPNKKLTLDRIDVNGNYSPKNCRWATFKQQNRNRRNNKLIFIFDLYFSLSEAVEKYSTVSYSAVQGRIKRGWDLSDALLLPKQLNTFKYKNKVLGST